VLVMALQGLATTSAVRRIHVRRASSPRTTHVRVEHGRQHQRQRHQKRHRCSCGDCQQQTAPGAPQSVQIKPRDAGRDKVGNHASLQSARLLYDRGLQENARATMNAHDSCRRSRRGTCSAPCSTYSAMIERRLVNQEAPASDAVNRDTYKGVYTLGRAENGCVAAQALPQAAP
jgi:hypothetical protein